MYTILMNLFNGNLKLSERPPSDLPMSDYYAKEFGKLKKQFDSLLNEEGQELLGELLETSAFESHYNDMDSFATGFRFGALLMVEVFQDKDDLILDKEQHLRYLIRRPIEGPNDAD